MAASPDPREVEEFLFQEARFLDEGRFEEWLALFTETAWYWVPLAPDQDNPEDMVSIIYDDRRLLETRVRRLCSPNIHAQAPPEGLRESLRSFRSFAQAGILQSRAPACSDPASNPGVAL